MTTRDVESGGHHVDIGDTRLYVVERGEGYPLLVFHGGPGLDHHWFGGYLGALADGHRLIPGDAAQTIVSNGIPSARYLEQIDRNLAAFEPIELREQVTSSWDREKRVR